MSNRAAITLSMIIVAMPGVATSASGHEKTRAEVRQELIRAENNGLQFVTDTSYPEVNPIFEQQVAHLKQRSDTTQAGADTYPGPLAV